MKRTQLAAIASGGFLAMSLSALAGNDLHDPMKTMDTNGDGMVSAAEHAAGAKAMFTKLDTDGDGQVTAAEMDAAHKGMAGGKGMHEMSSAEKIKAIDTDGDGRLSAAEHAAGSEAMFAKGDANHDGSLDAAEMQAARAGMMKDHRMDKDDMQRDDMQQDKVPEEDMPQDMRDDGTEGNPADD